MAYPLARSVSWVVTFTAVMPVPRSDSGDVGLPVRTQLHCVCASRCPARGVRESAESTRSVVDCVRPPSNLAAFILNSSSSPVCYSPRFSSHITVQSGNSDTSLPSFPALSFAFIFACGTWLGSLPERWRPEVVVVGTHPLTPVPGGGAGALPSAMEIRFNVNTPFSSRKLLPVFILLRVFILNGW